MQCNIILPAGINSYGICSLFRKIPKQNFNNQDKQILEFLHPHLCNQASNDRIKKERKNSPAEIESNLSGALVLDQKGNIQYLDEDFKKIIVKYNKKSNLKHTIGEIFRIAKKIDPQVSKELLYRPGKTPGIIEIICSEGRESNQCTYYCRIFDLAEIIYGSLKSAEEAYHLTSAEMKIFEGILQGKAREEIAKECYISLPSVKKHIASLYRKMDVTNQAQLLVKLGITINPEY